MNVTRLRTAIEGLIGFAAAADAELLAEAGDPATAEPGSPDRWAAVPLVAHNTAFKQQQVVRLEAVLNGTTPPAFAEVDHRSADYYRECSEQPLAEVAETSRDVAAALIKGLYAVSDEDLLDPARHPWLGGRQLSLQIIVRGFWHPLGHIGDYYLDHGRSDRACELQVAALVEASRPGVPDAARGMAHYSLACVQARAQLSEAAVDSLRLAVVLNPDLTANIRRDGDLAGLRASGRLDFLLVDGQ